MEGVWTGDAPNPSPLVSTYLNPHLPTRPHRHLHTYPPPTPPSYQHPQSIQQTSHPGIRTDLTPSALLADYYESLSWPEDVFTACSGVLGSSLFYDPASLGSSFSGGSPLAPLLAALA